MFTNNIKRIISFAMVFVICMVSMTLTVANAAVKPVIITHQKVSLSVDSYQDISLIGPTEKIKSVSWSCSNNNIAKVKTKGKKNAVVRVTGKKKGTVTITGKVLLKSGSKVTVKSKITVSDKWALILDDYAKERNNKVSIKVYAWKKNNGIKQLKFVATKNGKSSTFISKSNGKSFSDVITYLNKTKRSSSKQMKVFSAYRDALTVTQIERTLEAYIKDGYSISTAKKLLTKEKTDEALKKALDILYDVCSPDLSGMIDASTGWLGTVSGFLSNATAILEMYGQGIPDIISGLDAASMIAFYQGPKDESFKYYDFNKLYNAIK